MTQDKEIKHKKFRAKLSCGITMGFTIHKTQNGWKIFSGGKAKIGKRPVPLDFVPFEISNGIINGPAFPTMGECEAYARGL